MQRRAFIMKLYKGFEAEYKRRHDEIWPELQALLKQTGIQEYSIFLDERTNNLFGYLQFRPYFIMAPFKIGRAHV